MKSKSILDRSWQWLWNFYIGCVVILILVGLLAHRSQALSQYYTSKDVSLLLPLSQIKTSKALLGTALGKHDGELLPLHIMKRMPNVLNRYYDRPQLLQSELRLVGVRLDPCSPEKCEQEIKLIWQPVTGENKEIEDVALHSFYRLNFEEWKYFLQEWRSVIPESDSFDLGVHQTVSVKELSTVLIRFIGEDNLYKITFMGQVGYKNFWNFGGFEKNQDWQRITIPKVNSYEQTFINQPQEWQKYFYNYVNYNPKSIADSFLEKMEVVFKNKEWIDVSDPETLNLLQKAETMSSALIHKTKEHHALNTDCLSCHVAPQVNQVSRSYLGLKNDLERQPTTNLRMFGYFKDQAVISARVKIETAAVVEQMNRSY